MKTCKDCKWVSDPGKFAKCTYPTREGSRTGFDTGRDISYCVIQRDAGWLWKYVAPQGRCGKSGRWWEPK